MASLNMSVKHGQPFETAKANFEKGLTAAQEKHSIYIKTVAWSDDRTSAKLSGPGYEVTLHVDQDSVHANGSVPFFVKFMEGPIRKFVEETLGNQ